MRPTLIASLLLLTACDGSTVDVLDDLGLIGLYFVELDAEPAEVAGLVATLAESFEFEPIHVYDSAAEGFSVELPHLLAPELEAAPGVERVLADEERSLVDPLDGESGIVLGEDEIPAGIARVGGPYMGSADLGAIHVAVLDTGIDGGHPDLNVVAELDLVGQRTGDTVDGEDPNGHGTHVAGTIGAFGDTEGVVGLAPGIPLHAVRVLDENGSGAFSDVVAGLEYVLEHPEIRVVNLSLGAAGQPSNLDPLKKALQRVQEAGVVVCIAAGNADEDTAETLPAAYDYGLVVSAYDSSQGDQGFASFSNHGAEVDLGAPGVRIESTWPGSEYARLDGTSMATPHVAGALAVYLALDPSKTVEEALDDAAATAEDGLEGQSGEHPEPLLDAASLWARVGG